MDKAFMAYPLAGGDIRGTLPTRQVPGQYPFKRSLLAQGIPAARKHMSIDTSCGTARYMSACETGGEEQLVLTHDGLNTTVLGRSSNLIESSNLVSRSGLPMARAAPPICRSNSCSRLNDRMMDPSKISVICKISPSVFDSSREETEDKAYLADLREGSASTPLEDGVHQLHLETLNILVGYKGNLALGRYCRYSPSNFLHATERLR